MSVYKEKMDRIQPRTPPEELAAAVVGARRRNVRVPKPLTAIAASIAAAAALTVTASAVVSLLDLGRVMRNGFGDEVSSEKLAARDYQPLDLSAENDMVTLKASALVGDGFNSYILAEAKLKEAPAGDAQLYMTTVMFDDNTSAEKLERYGRSTYAGVPGTDENGDTVYVFKIKCYPYFIWDSFETGVNVTSRIERTYLKYTDKIRVVTDNNAMELNFLPDKSVLREPNTTEFNEELIINGKPCTLKYFSKFDYCERVAIDYIPNTTVEDKAEFMGMTVEELEYEGLSGYTIDEYLYGRSILGIKNRERSLTVDKCPIRLIKDGEYVPYLYKDLDGEEREYWDRDKDQPYDIFFHVDEYNNVLYTETLELRFEPFDMNEADSVMLEIQTDGGVRTYTIK